MFSGKMLHVVALLRFPPTLVFACPKYFHGSFKSATAAIFKALGTTDTMKINGAQLAR